jgi:hypothetical protein
MVVGVTPWFHSRSFPPKKWRNHEESIAALLFVYLIVGLIPLVSGFRPHHVVQGLEDSWICCDHYTILYIRIYMYIYDCIHECAVLYNWTCTQLASFDYRGTTRRIPGRFRVQPQSPSLHLSAKVSLACIQCSLNTQHTYEYTCVYSIYVFFTCINISTNIVPIYNLGKVL